MLKHEWDYMDSNAGGKTSVKIHNVPGKKNQKFIINRWCFFNQFGMGGTNITIFTAVIVEWCSNEESE